MKKSLLTYKSLVLMALMIFSSYAQGQLVLYEGFDYTLPGYIGGNGNAGSSSNNWTTHSVTSGQTTTIDLYSGSLSYTGLNDPIGNKVLIFGNANATSRDVNRAITTTNTVLYFSGLIKLIDNSGITTTGDYFMHFGATSGTSVTVFGGRLGVKSVNAGANFRFMIQNTSGGTPTFTEFPTDMSFGTTYLVVVKYDRSTSPTTATLWVNPSPLGGSDPSGSVSNSSGTGSFSSFASICLRNNATTPKAEIDEIYIGETFASVTPGLDLTAPSASFDPVNSATNIAISISPTVTFDEPVRKTDASELTNADLATLVTLRETDAAGATVAFTGTIDAAKKVITITPSANLKNNQLYYLAVGPVEDAAGNESTLKSITFTTISAATPTVTLTAPVGGETFYAGQNVDFTWTSANITNVKIEAWVMGSDRTYKWENIVESIPAAAGTLNFNIPADALYGTQYKIRISDASNAAVNSVSGDFTLIAVATSLANLRTRCILNDVVKLTSEITLTFIRGTGSNKYAQDATAGILIYDPSGILTTPLNNGDNFKDLEGKVAFYGGVYEIIPTKSSVTVTSSGNTITPPEMTLTQYNANYLNYESELIRLTEVYFPTADGSATFPSGGNVNLTDGTTTIVFRTFYTGESDIVGSVIPTSHIKMTCLGGFYNTTVQVYSRTLADFEILTGIEKGSLRDVVRLYPVPASSVLNVSGTPNLRSVDILDAAGKLIRTINTSTEEVVRIPVGTLKRGTYMIRLNTADGAVIKRFVKQ